MAASFASRPKRLGAGVALTATILAALVFLGAFPATAVQGEPIALSSANLERGVAVGVDELARLSLPALGASPVAAAAIHSAASVVIFPSEGPIQDLRAKRSLKAVSTEPKNEDEPAALAVPEPTTLILGLTSTLVLGSLSWKRRLTHHHPSRG